VRGCFQQSVSRDDYFQVVVNLLALSLLSAFQALSGW